MIHYKRKVVAQQPVAVLKKQPAGECKARTPEPDITKFFEKYCF